MRPETDIREFEDEYSDAWAFYWIPMLSRPAVLGGRLTGALALAQCQTLNLAGGLEPENVASAVAQPHPLALTLQVASKGNTKDAKTARVRRFYRKQDMAEARIIRIRTTHRRRSFW